MIYNLKKLNIATYFLHTVKVILNRQIRNAGQKIKFRLQNKEKKIMDTSSLIRSETEIK